jgi:hypothetical protein
MEYLPSKLVRNVHRNSLGTCYNPTKRIAKSRLAMVEIPRTR